MGRGIRSAADMEPAIDSYSGIDNLEVMAKAVRYRRYLGDLVVHAAGPPRPDDPVLDFGAGSGTQATELRDRGYQVCCIEPDSVLREHLVAMGFTVGRSTDDFAGEQFRTIYTMNVLEHIADDREALRSLVSLLAPGGALVVYVPAFQLLYSSMDAKVGHLRRYRRRDLIGRVGDAGLTVRHCRYADSLGFFASLAYRAMGVASGDLNARGVALYDGVVFPVSRRLDMVTGRWFGKNLSLVAERRDVRDGG